MEMFSYYSYLTASAAYFLLLFITLKGIKKNPFAFSLIVALIISIVWSGYTAFTLQNDDFFISETFPFETLRNAAWFLLISVIISSQQLNGNYAIFFKSRATQGMFIMLVIIFVVECVADLHDHITHFMGMDIRLFAHVIFAIIGLMLIEQLYRNAFIELRWTIKFLCLGLGALFTIDFIVYSKSLLFGQLDQTLWISRGLLNALIVPLLAISVIRLQQNTRHLTMSRKAVFHTSALLGTGLYLITMSMAGFYIRDYDGNWGEFAQIIFIFLAILLLLILFVSGKIRAMAKVYLSKHFFHYRYDYRDEWVKLSKTIAQLSSIEEISSFIIRTMANLVDSSGGGLWLKNEQGDYYLAEDINLGFEAPDLISSNNSMIEFITRKQWVIDFEEFFNDPEIYDEVDLTQWYTNDSYIWLIIPLLQQNELKAVIVLTQARVPRQLNFEDHDLLKTVGMQLANALTLSHTSDELSRSRQFEAYNRLSAFVVHDLKNLLAQISLIVKNAEKHKHNPEFIDDSIETLENVVKKTQNLVEQLKKGNLQADKKLLIDLVNVIKDVEIQQAGNKPVLKTNIAPGKYRVFGENEKMTAILGHLIQNAQEATDDSGQVILELTELEQKAIIKIIDTGQGMDRKFVSERLFKPFDTTKGNAGMGIGVYEAREYILNHSGQLNVDSTPNKGTVFTIQLPIIQQITE